MCGRYKLVAPVGRIFDEFSLVGLRPNLPARYNIAPTQEAAIVRRMPTGRQIALIRWGLIPAWAPAQRPGVAVPTGQINARAETVAEKPTFKDALRYRRCLVIADGFYEWAQEGREKQPMLFEATDGGLLAFAGLYERWEKGETPLESFTIICTQANELVGQIHDRMPVILPRDTWDTWLDPHLHDAGAVTPLLTSYPADAMTMRPVNRDLGKVSRDDESLLVPQLPQQPSLF